MINRLMLQYLISPESLGSNDHSDSMLQGDDIIKMATFSHTFYANCTKNPEFFSAFLNYQINNCHSSNKWTFDIDVTEEEKREWVW